MAIFVSEPGRPQGTQLPTAITNRQVATVTETSPTQAVDPKKNDSTDAEFINAMRSAERAVAEYQGVSRTEPDAKRNYLPVSVLATNKLISLPAMATMGEALALMEQHGIGHIVLTDNDGIAGLVSREWITYWLYKQKADATGLAFNDVELPPFLTASPETDAHIIARLMLAHELRAALIINRTTKPVGIVTVSDYLQLYAEANSTQNQV